MSGQPSAIDYTSRDWASARKQMLDRAAEVMPEWRGAVTGDPNDFGVVVIEALAYEADVLSYYNDRLANESFLSTATQRASVLAHAALLGYTPRSATSATATLQLTITSTTGFTLPTGFQFATMRDEDFQPLVFETVADLDVPANTTDGTFQVNVVEGTTVDDEVVATSCGDLDASYTLSQTPVVSDSVVIRVVEAPNDPGQVWFPVNNLLDVGAGDNAYAYSVGAGDSFTITFGDGVNGRVPPRGAVIHARYRVGGGSDGNVDAGTIVDVVDPTYIDYPTTVSPGDPAGLNPPVISVTNPEPATGGTDSEDLDSIRRNVPRSLQARNRAVSLVDYEALALTVPTIQVAKAKAVGQVYTNITVYVAPPGGGTPSQAMLAAVVDYFGPRKMVGASVVAATPTYVPVYLTLSVVVDPRYSQALVQQRVQTEVNALLAFDNVDFGFRVALADIYTAVQAVEGVRNVVITQLSTSSSATTAADVVLRENEVPVAGTLTVKATGGVVNSGAATVSGGAASPTASNAPTITLLRCDPNSTHVELAWNAAANSTSWDVVVSYLNAQSVVISSTVAGPYSSPAANIDLPLIGSGRATQISFTTRAYNGSVGPALSPATTTTYTCG